LQKLCDDIYFVHVIFYFRQRHQNS